MKKAIRFILTTAGIAAIPAAINYLIFKSSETKYAEKTKNRIYEWTYGDIHYTKCGNGKPLLLLHGIGTGASNSEWKRSVNSLSKKYTVYAVDLLGFGDSGKPALTYSAYLFTQLINDFIKNVIKEKTYAAANANSAAFALAAHCLDPRWIEKLLLIAPVGAGTTKPNTCNLSPFIKKALEFPLIGTTAYAIISSKLYSAYFLKRFCYSDSKNINKEVVESYYSRSHSGGANSKYPIAAFIANYLTVDIERLISRINIPVHVIWGSDNELNPVTNFKHLEARNRNITLAIFDGTKLLPHDENPKAFIKECFKFFS